MGGAKVMMAALLAVFGQVPEREPAYAAGQVWEYRTRPGDEGSVLKIRKIETYPGLGASERVYHISIIGVALGPAASAGVIQHVPVSKRTLDESVVRQVRRDADFGDVDQGIAEWRQAEGGVFTIPVAEIVRVMAETLASAASQPQE